MRKSDARCVREAIRRGYDLRAPDFDGDPVRRRRAHRVDIPPIPAGACVLDIGCGTGRSTEPAMAQGRASLVVGLDLSAGMLRRAAATFAGIGGIALVQADAERLPFSACCFDLAISRRALSHLPDQSQAFAEIARILKPAGGVDVSVSGDRALGRPIERCLRTSLRQVMGSAAGGLLTLYRPPSIGALESAAYAAGLEAADVTATTAYSWDQPDRLVDRLLNATMYLRARLTPAQTRALETGLRANARAAAGTRGLPDWSYTIHYRGRKPTT